MVCVLSNRDIYKIENSEFVSFKEQEMEQLPKIFINSIRKKVRKDKHVFLLADIYTEIEQEMIKRFKNENKE